MKNLEAESLNRDSLIGPDEVREGFTIRLQPGKVARGLTIIVSILATVGTVANYVIYHVATDPDAKLARLMQRFDLGHEPSVPALYSSLALMGSAALLAIIGFGKRRQQARYAKHWLALSLIFVGLSIDECVMIHEMIDNYTANFIERSGALHFVWVIPGGLFVLFTGLAYLGFLRHLEARTRWLFIQAGALFVFGAIGMEMVAGVIAESSGLESLHHTFSQAVEETCEMLGVVLFIYALLDYLDRNVAGIHLRMSTVASGSTVHSGQH